MFAFVNEVIDTIRLDALKDRLHLLDLKRFRGELNKCRAVRYASENILIPKQHVYSTDKADFPILSHEVYGKPFGLFG